MHATAPELGLYVPASHLPDGADSPEALQNMPAGQGVHADVNVTHDTTDTPTPSKMPSSDGHQGLTAIAGPRGPQHKVTTP